MEKARLVAATLIALLALGSGIAFAAQKESTSSANASLTEVSTDRTETSRTFRLPNGKLETRLYQAPLNYQAGKGQWKPISERLREIEGATLENGANDFEVHLPKQIDSGPTRLTAGKQWVASELLGEEAGAVQLQGKTASYQGSESSFHYTGLADGLKESIEIKEPSDPSTYSFALSASAGLVPSLENGAVVFRDRAGQVVVTLPPPTMSDSAPQPTESRAVHYELGPEREGHWRFTVVADPKWLSSPDRVLPVTIDPTMVTGPPYGCVIGGHKSETGWIDCASWGRETFLVGYTPYLESAEDDWWRTLMNFETEAIPADARISSTAFHVYATEAAQNTEGVELREVTKPWTWQASWSRYDGPDHLWDEEGGDYSTELAKVLTSERGTAAGWWKFPLSAKAVQKLTSAGESLSFLAKLIDDKSRECTKESCTHRVVRFDSSAAEPKEDRPYLSVTYSVPTHKEPIASYNFDEGSGTTAHDSSGNGHEGTVEGAEWSKEGKFGGALRFDPTKKARVKIPDSDALDFSATNNLTLTAWVRPEEERNWSPIFAKTGATESDFAYLVYARGSGVSKAQLKNTAGTSANVWGKEALPQKAWSHLAVTSDGTNLRIYVNGELVGTEPTVVPRATTSDLRIGGNEQWGEYFNGKIDNVRIYDRALDGEEVADDEEAAVPAPTTGPVASYSFDEGEGQARRRYERRSRRDCARCRMDLGRQVRRRPRIRRRSLGLGSQLGDLNLSEAFTLEAWVRPSEEGKWAPLISKTEAEVPDASYQLNAGSEEAGRPSGLVANEELKVASVEGEEALPVGKWSNVVLTSDGEELCLYVDGELVATEADFPGETTEGPLRIGGDRWEEYFHGTIDNVRLYARALDVEEIATDKETAVPAPPPLSKAPIASYAFDEGSGETAHDVSGNGHNASLHGAEWTEKGKFGGALRFDATEHDRLTIPNSPELNFSGAFTLEAWVKPEEERNWAPIFAKTEAEESDYSYLVYARGSGVPKAELKDASGETANVWGKEALPVGEWSNVTLTSDGEELRIYVNGELAGTEPTVLSRATESALRIGGNEQWGEYFDGEIDNVRVYDRALDGPEIGDDRETPVDFSVGILGDAVEYGTLAAHPGIWPGSETVTFEYQWESCNEDGGECEEIEGARHRTYTPEFEDRGHALRVVVKVAPGPSRVGALGSDRADSRTDSRHLGNPGDLWQRRPGPDAERVARPVGTSRRGPFLPVEEVRQRWRRL